MFQNTRISRRNFLKLNAMLSSAVAVSIALPAVAVAKSIPTAASAAPEALDLAHPTAIRFGTPTDVAATWHGVAWSVDASGVIRKYDPAQRVWVSDADEADLEGDFPLNSELVLARWGRPSGPNQMLMVLAQAQ
jgi:hypothetical protein